MSLYDYRLLRVLRNFIFWCILLMVVLRSGYGHLLEPGWRRRVWDQMARTRIEGGEGCDGFGYVGQLYLEQGDYRGGFDGA